MSSDLVVRGGRLYLRSPWRITLWRTHVCPESFVENFNISAVFRFYVSSFSFSPLCRCLYCLILTVFFSPCSSAAYILSHIVMFHFVFFFYFSLLIFLLLPFSIFLYHSSSYLTLTCYIYVEHSRNEFSNYIFNYFEIFLVFYYKI